MLTREQLLSKREELFKRINILEVQKFEYVVERPLYQFGYVSEMQKENLVPAFAKVKELSFNLKAAAEELGIPYNNVNDNDDMAMLGYPVSAWKHDFKTRVEELNNNEIITRLKNALILIEKNLSEEDKFKLDMDNVAYLLCDE